MNHDDLITEAQGLHDEIDAIADTLVNEIVRLRQILVEMGA